MRKGLCVAAFIAMAVFTLTPVLASQSNATNIAKERGRYTLSISLEFSRKNRNAAERALSILTDMGPNAYASGFVVGDGLVMTAYHVVSGRLSDSKKRILGFKPQDELQVKAYVNGCPARVVKVDREADLALLAVCTSSKEAKRPTFQLEPTKNEQLLLIAQPRDSKFLRRGVFTGQYTFRGQQYLSAKIDALDGFSGSPVYNEQGQVVGVFCGYDWQEGVAFMSPGVKAQKFLQEYEAGAQTQ
ncbi:MAG TPA: serine protease [Blastocatellia bacterium]|nr:serine protease [Blastocatellia bacterium]